MKNITINKNNIETFAEEMFRFNCFHQYNSMCFSTNDILRERTAFHETDIILEKLNKAGFDVNTVKAFKEHNWNVEDLTGPVKENPVLTFQSEMYEKYLDIKNIREYYES